jgi:hypothetical protein
MSGLIQFLAQHPGDYRIANTHNPNSALSLRIHDLWGNDPNVLLRYAQFMAPTAGLDPDKATQYLPFRGLHPWHAMVRCQFAFVQAGDGKIDVHKAQVPPLDRLHLIRNYRVLTTRDEMFAAMNAPTFDPRSEVILETEPNPIPASGGTNDEVKLLESGADYLSVEASLTAPAILLITDNYAKGWRVRSVGPPAQPEYRILPANYFLRAIPLAAGHHRIRVEYVPAGFVIGKWISVAAVLGWLALLGWQLRKRFKLPTA